MADEGEDADPYFSFAADEDRKEFEAYFTHSSYPCGESLDSNERSAMIAHIRTGRDISTPAFAGLRIDNGANHT